MEILLKSQVPIKLIKQMLLYKLYTAHLLTEVMAQKVSGRHLNQQLFEVVPDL